MVMDVYLAVPDPDALGLREDDGEGVVANKKRDAKEDVLDQLHMPLVWTQGSTSFDRSPIAIYVGRVCNS